jgi:hypothetical protein
MSKLDPAIGMGMEMGIDLRLEVETEYGRAAYTMMVNACSPENLRRRKIGRRHHSHRFRAVAGG